MFHSGITRKHANKNYGSITKYLSKVLSKANLLREVLPLHSQRKIMMDEINLLTSYSSDTIYKLCHKTMQYKYISPAIVRLLGFSKEEMQKINFRSLILETRIVTNSMQRIDSFEKLEKLRKEGQVSKWQADYLMRTKDGRKIWVTDVSFPWLNEKGEVIGSVGSLRDITDRVNTEEKAKEQILKLANTDALTGLASRHSFFDVIGNELKRFRRSQRHFSILIVDIDRFKKVNDKFGHDIGDKFLVEVSNIIESCVRDTDMVARLGGEEFGLFLPDTTEEGAYWVADIICKKIAKYSFYADNQSVPVNLTVSIGVSSTKGFASPDISDIYKRADARLYIAKHTGCNQVSVDEIMHMH